MEERAGITSILCRDLVGVAERLRLSRVHGGFSQEEFAQKLGYTRRQINAWERAHSAPPIWALMGVRQFCDVDPEWILFGYGSTPMREFAPPDVDRFPRLRAEVSVIAETAGMTLPDEALCSLAQMIARQEPGSEKRLRDQIAAVLQAIGSEGIIARS